MSRTYFIQHIKDVFLVPAEKRDACFRDVQYAMALMELALGEDAGASCKGILWTDDDNHSCSLRIDDGTEEIALALEVTKA